MHPKHLPPRLAEVLKSQSPILTGHGQFTETPTFENARLAVAPRTSRPPNLIEAVRVNQRVTVGGKTNVCICEALIVRCTPHVVSTSITN